MTTNLSELAGRPVLDVATATTVATVRHAVIDPGTTRVVALAVDPVDGSADLLPWSAIKAIGPDAVTVDSADALREATDDRERRAADGDLDPLGKLLLGDDGTAGGVVTEIAVDDETGTLREVLTAEHRSDGAAVVGVGGYAVVVTRAAS